MPRRWLRPSGDELVWRQWGEACVLYHGLSGQTHFLNELAFWTLTNLGGVPESGEQISQRLAAAFDGEVTTELVDAVEATLKVLEHLGLVDAAT